MKKIHILMMAAAIMVAIVAKAACDNPSNGQCAEAAYSICTNPNGSPAYCPADGTKSCVCGMFAANTTCVCIPPN